MKHIRVLLVDDHAVMRMGLASLLATNKEIEVVADVGDGESAVKKAVQLKPDVVLMDLMMPGMDGVETTRALLQKQPETKVIIFTTFGTADGIGHALDAGAKGALLKTVGLKELVSAIRKVDAGEMVLAPEIEQLLSENPTLPELSKRQSEILNSIIRGLSNQDIARQLGISVPMVKEHLNVLFTKIGAANRTEAVAIALRKHLLKI